MCTTTSRLHAYGVTFLHSHLCAFFRCTTCDIGSQTSNDSGQFDSVDVVTGGNFVTGVQYTIQRVGTTLWTDIGASAVPAPAVDVVFTATGPGNGDGVARRPVGATACLACAGGRYQVRPHPGTKSSRLRLVYIS